MTGTKKDNYYAILMAGGVGSRFWPASKSSRPKQFQDILGVGETLFQTTYKRLSHLIPFENIYILTNESYIDMIREQIPQIAEEQIVPEPVMRNTAPSILLGALKIQQKNPNALTVVAPSDHWIENQDEFLKSVELAFNSVEKKDRIVTLGIEPDSPKTGYGYIEYDKSDNNNIKKVKKFTEKPNLKQAEEFIEASNYVWNAGIFIWRTSFILECFNKYLPDMYRLFQKGEQLWNTPKETEFIKNNYAKAANISIDYGIMEKAEEVFVIPVTYKWNDLGTWSSVQNELPTDEDGNTAVNCRLLAENSSNNIISGQNGKVVAIKGLKNYIVVEDEEVLLIIPKSDEQDIKKIREQVMKDFGDELG